MGAFYFGESDKPLFGYHHPARSSHYQHASIVICNPIGHEYIRSYNALRNLAKQLAEQGYHVLRFDYYATGDSSGDSEQGSVNQWMNDIKTARDEIVDISGDKKIYLIGLRFGALLGFLVAQTVAFDRMLFWDPVCDGKQYLANLEKMQQLILRDADRFSLNNMSITKTTDEYLGHPFLSELQHEIKMLSFNKVTTIKTNKIDIFSAEEKPQSVMNYFESLTTTNEFFWHNTEDNGEWNNFHKIEDMLIATGTITGIINLIN